MTLFTLCAAVVLPFMKKGSALTPDLYKRVQRLCRAAVGGDSGTQQLRYEELLEAVMEKLLADDCRRLREIESDNPTHSWLRTVIRRTSTDLFRKEAGRPDWHKLGEHSQTICKMVFTYGYPADEVQLLLKEYPPHVEISVQEIDRIVYEIQNRGRFKYHPDGTAEVVALKDEETGMVKHDFTSVAPIPDEILAGNERMQALQLFLMRLTGEDKLLISLFFGLDDDKMSLKEIAEILKSTETALQKRKNRLIADFQEWLRKQRLNLDELVSRQVVRSTS